MRSITLAFSLLLALSFSTQAEVTATPVDAAKTIDLVIETSMGKVEVELNSELAPISVANFMQYVDSGYYNGTIFHRVINNFMVQGGDPTGTGSGGPGYKFKNEIHPELSHSKAGIFSMANSGPNTNGSQFFITHGPTPHLDGAYNVFGEVVMGQNIITLMGGVPKNRNNKPNSPIIMKKVSILRIGDAAKKFDANETFTKLK